MLPTLTEAQLAEIQGMESTTRLPLQAIVARERKRMQTFLNEGPPSVYMKNGEFDTANYWADFWPDFSWNAYSMIELQAVMDDLEWHQLAVKVEIAHGVSIVAEVELGIEQTPFDI